MSAWWPYLGDLYDVLPLHWAGAAALAASLICGLIIGAEREAKNKSAGLRTLMLICTGSTVFTLGSVLLAGPNDDRTRIAAQVVTGIGFLGAGAIIRHRGAVHGLTTGASIWTAAAIGLVAGAGYAAAAIALTVLVVIVLVVVGKIEHGLSEPCRFGDAQIRFGGNGGKTRLRLRRILDEYHIPDAHWSFAAEGDGEVLRVRYCTNHRAHRAVLYELAEVDGVSDARS